MTTEDFESDLVRWVGPLIPEDARRRLKAILRDRRMLREQGVRTKPGVFPLGNDLTSDAFLRRYEQGVHPEDANADVLYPYLRSLGAPGTCRVLNGTVGGYDDGSIVPLREALEWATGEGDGSEVILLCVPGRLAYFQDHNYIRAIVHRPSGDP